MSQAAALEHEHYHVVMASFDGVEAAVEAVRRLRAEGAFAGLEVEAEAVLSRDGEGRLRVHEKGSEAIGAVFGVATAGLVGLVTGPVVLLAMVVAGALAGGIAGHFAGQAIPPEDLRRVGASLPPGSSAWLAVVDRSHAAALAARFDAAGARTLDVAVETELSSAVREGITHQVVRV